MRGLNQRPHQAVGLLERNVAARSSGERSTSPIAIVSGKGGVGKSAIAVNLATAVSITGASSLLIDGDAGLANADLLMGVVPRFDLQDWRADRATLAEVASIGPAGLELWVEGTHPSAMHALERDLAMGARGELGHSIARADLCLLDLGAGIGGAVLDVARRCDRILLIATPEPTSLADAYAMAKQLWERDAGLGIELIVNRAPDPASGERTHGALDRMVQRFLGRSLPLRAVLPDDAAMQRAVLQQRPVVIEEPQAPVARRIALLAESLIEERGVALGV